MQLDISMENNKTYYIYNMFIFIIILCLSFTFTSANALASKHAKYAVDIFKTKQITLNEIEIKYKKQFQDIADVLLSPESMTIPKNDKFVGDIMKMLLVGVGEMGDFAFLEISSTLYPDKNVIYFTIDAVDKNDKNRLEGFLIKQKENIPDPDHLIENWMVYDKISQNMFLTSKAQPKYKICPAFHCILYGFDYPAFKKYINIFNIGVPKNKNNLIKILRNDKDEKKRTAAAYLLAHLKNGNEIIRVLTPSIKDSSQEVRNSVMRVLGETLSKLKTPDFPIQETVKALQFPTASDRNKALSVIYSLINQPRYARYIVKYAGSDLIDQLKLSQPNVHDYSYVILKKLSNKNYGDRDYASWEKWLNDNKI